MFKQFLHKTHYIILALVIVCGIIFSTNPGNITSKVINRIYPEYIISNADFGTQKAELKDFSQNTDGSITSTTADPWIYIAFEPNGMERIFLVDIEIQHLSNEGEVTFLYPIESYGTQELVLSSGTNRTRLTHLTELDYGVRFDLASDTNQTLYIDKFIFNNNSFLTTYFGSKVAACTIWLTMLLTLLLVSEFAFKNRNKIWFNETSGKQFIFLCGISVLILSFIGIWPLAFAGMACMIYVQKHISGQRTIFTLPGILCFLLTTVLGLIFAWLAPSLSSWVLVSIDAKLIFTLLLLLLWSFFNKDFDISISSLIYIMIHGHLLYVFTSYPEHYIIKYGLFNARLTLNLLLFLSVVILFKKLLGKRLGNAVFYIIFASYTIANLVKIHYQNSLFSSADLKIGSEIIGIAGQYITKGQAIAMVSAIIILSALVIRYRRFLKEYLKPQFSFYCIPATLIVWILCQSIVINSFPSIVNVEGQHLTNQSQINELGFGVYTLLEFSNNQNTNEPEGYSENIVDECATYKDYSTESDEQPTVILILAESLFEADKIPDITYNQDLFTNLAPYKATNIISPSYGGRTAVAEFEALTGLSNLFIENDVVPHSVYLNTPGNDIGSVAREFSNNGYATYAIHANQADYYNRETVYQNMGFDTYISEEDFTLSSEDYLNDGLINDTVFVDTIIETLESSDKPTFIFGISLEGHSPYSDKYVTTDIIADSEEYDNAALTELSGYGQSAYNFDREMGRLFKYVENSNTPTLIYIFGDHLPPLAVYNETDYLNDVYLKYKTPLYVYSNYCDTFIHEEYISLSQVAPELLRKSGISYSAYFDYIYQLRQNYPVTHKNVISDTDNPELQLYKKIQWDFLFGEKYLLN